MKPVLGCIADDFTGATDLAALLARSGANVSLHMGVPASGDNSEVADIEIVALKCRTTPVNDAVTECLAAFDWLKSRGAERFFWKYCSTFDSTAEGNIGPVAEALMQACGATQTIYCPAFPENGRSIFMGNLFVGQQPLAESPMKDHPLTPMRDSNLMRLLEPQVTKPVGLVDRLTVAKGADAIAQAMQVHADNGVAHIVTDAVANEDLFAIAKACSTWPLLTGGSAIAMPLPDEYVSQSLLSIQSTTPYTEQVSGGAVVLSGSCSAMTRQQVKEYSSHSPHYRLDAIDIHNNGIEAACQWLAGQPMDASPILYATAEPETVQQVQQELGANKAGELIEQALATLAQRALESGRQKIIVAGGESSGAVTQALGVDHLKIGQEIAPGVPWCYATSEITSDGASDVTTDGASEATNGPRNIALALKSGNFGSPTFFRDALALL